MKRSYRKKRISRKRKSTRRKTYRRKTYRRKTYKRKSYKRKSYKRKSKRMRGRVLRGGADRAASHQRRSRPRPLPKSNCGNISSKDDCNEDPYCYWNTRLQIKPDDGMAYCAPGMKEPGEWKPWGRARVPEKRPVKTAQPLAPEDAAKKEAALPDAPLKDRIPQDSGESGEDEIDLLEILVNGEDDSEDSEDSEE